MSKLEECYHWLKVDEIAYLNFMALLKEFPIKGLLKRVILEGVQVVYEQLEHQREVSPIKEAWKDIETEGRSMISRTIWITNKAYCALTNYISELEVNATVEDIIEEIIVAGIQEVRARRKMESEVEECQ